MAWGLPSTASLARFCQKLNRLKPLEESTTEMSQQRHLTVLDLILLGMGATMGLGLYMLTGTVAKEMAGPAVLVSFSVAVMASLLAALCYVELAARVPRKGTSYLFTYVFMGELWAFLIGWILLIQCLIGGIAMARTWSSSPGRHLRPPHPQLHHGPCGQLAGAVPGPVPGLLGCWSHTFGLRICLLWSPHLFLAQPHLLCHQLGCHPLHRHPGVCPGPSGELEH